MKRFLNSYTILILFVILIGAVIIGTLKYVRSNGPSTVPTSLKEYSQAEFNSDENKAIHIALRDTVVPSSKTKITVIQTPDSPSQYFVTFKQPEGADSKLWVRVDIAVDKIISVDTGGV